MNWDQARRLLHLAGDSAGGGGAIGEAAFDPAAEAVDSMRAGSLCIASGKGGTGKSVVTASLATVFARTTRTLIVDADLGVGNAHILQDVTPELSFVDVVDGRLSVGEIRVPCRANLDLLGGGSGVSRMAGLSSWELHMLARGIEVLEPEYGRLVVDSAAGISRQTIAFAAASDAVLIVTTPDVTALTDAYAFLKALLQRRPDCEPAFVVNRATSEEEAQRVAERVVGVSRKFLDREPRFVGALPDDRAVTRSVNARVPAVIHEPGSAFAQAVEVLAVKMAETIERHRPKGLGRSLMRSAGYSPKSS
jgi:flagellar biosynthesis protein FlhG